MIEKDKLKFLDSIRGFAAIYVLLGHARWLLYEGWSTFELNKGKYDIASKLLTYFFLLFKYGHEMVIFFFILSGFVIHLKYAEKLKEDITLKFDWISYIKRRFFRIFPPFFFAIVLTFLADKIVESNNFSIYNHSTPIQLINDNVTFNHSFTTFLGNLFFLQGGFIPIFGSNGPLWSLMYEWWFYMLYPILFLIYRKNIYLSYAVVAIVFIVFLLGGTSQVILIDKVLSYLFIWWLGVILADIYVGNISLNKKWFFPFVILLSLIPFYPKLHLEILYQDSITAIGVFSLFTILFYLYDKKSILIH